MGDWADHSATTGGYYRCNRFDRDDDDSAGGDQSDAAKTKWEQYLYYYKRYHGHEEAQKFAASATCTPCPTNNMKTKY